MEPFNQIVLGVVLILYVVAVVWWFESIKWYRSSKPLVLIYTFSSLYWLLLLVYWRGIIWIINMEYVFYSVCVLCLTFLIDNFLFWLDWWTLYGLSYYSYHLLYYIVTLPLLMTTSLYNWIRQLITRLHLVCISFSILCIPTLYYLWILHSLYRFILWFHPLPWV